MTTVALIACTKNKHGQFGDVLPAVDLYSASPLFRHSLAYARRLQPMAIWVLSGMFGLIALDELLPYYQLYLATQPAAYRRAWAERVLARLLTEHSTPSTAVFLAGAAYVEPLRRPLLDAGWTISEPLRGLGVGQRLRWLKTQ
ncbi:MAG: hypothetical protein KKA73_18405 [Chloroflexi bacterium]|nr:hypothetical protein [Chloroflexota bacterium]MBU1749660.1 hypothetical protein [Chloroflexota bacterium]